MKAFEKMEKREERRKEALQRINEKKESPVEAEPSKPVPEPSKLPSPVIPAAKPAAKSTPITRNASTTKPNPVGSRKKRNSGGPALRRRTTSTNGVSAAAVVPVSAPRRRRRLTSDANTSNEGGSVAALQLKSSPLSPVPAPAEVGSTYTGTVSSVSTSLITNATSSASTGFRFPKTKKVSSLLGILIKFPCSACLRVRLWNIL